MTNGLFEVDGVDVAGLVAEHLGPRVLPAALLKPGAPGGRDPDNPTRVLPDGAPTSHPCRGFIEDFRSADIDGTLIKAGDRKITLLAGTLPAGVVPDCGVGRDRITIEGGTWTAHRLVSRDPAAATYVIQARDPAAAPEDS